MKGLIVVFAILIVAQQRIWRGQKTTNKEGVTYA